MRSRDKHRRDPASERAAQPIRMPRVDAAILLGLSLLGLVVSLYLTYVHFRLYHEPGWQSACAMSAVASCDTVVGSSYGSAGGVPLSAIGAWFYALAAIVSAADLRRRLVRFPRSRALVLFLGAAAATVLSVILAGLSAFVLGALCPLCMLLYLVNLATLVLAWRALRAGGDSISQSLAMERRYWGRHVLSAFGYSVLALGALAALFPLYSTESLAPSALCEVLAEAAARGALSRPITLLVYADFQCPRCRELDVQLRSIRGNSQWRIDYRHFPLESECNPDVTRKGHPGSCLQARAAICSEALGGPAAFSDRLFEGGPREGSELATLAVSLGIDRDRFEGCLRSADTAKRLDEDIAAGRRAGVGATPTVFVEGTRHVGVLKASDLGCLMKAGTQTRSP